MKTLALGLAALTLGLSSASALELGAGDKMMKAKKSADIVDAAIASENLSTLVAAVTAGDLVGTLKGDGPFTVFAPTNAAFAEVQSAVDTLLKPENKGALQGVLTYHVVAAELSATDLVMLIKANGGMVKLGTVAGGILTVALSGENVVVTDANGGTATVVAADITKSNGVVHVIDTVLMP